MKEKILLSKHFNDFTFSRRDSTASLFFVVWRRMTQTLYEEIPSNSNPNKQELSIFKEDYRKFIKTIVCKNQVVSENWGSGILG